MRRIGVITLGIMFLVGLTAAGAVELTDPEKLGKNIFFDENLSINGNQSCAACHKPESGWTGPDGAINAGGAVYEGSVPGSFGDRKPPSAAYATPSPILHYVMQKKEALFIGGNFWDGRATGERLGSPAAEQAQGPFLNPVEQALPDAACVVYRVCNAAYPVTIEAVYPGSCSISWPADIDTVCASEIGTVALSPEDRNTLVATYDKIALAIAAYEGSTEVNQYTSKYDAFLKGQVTLSKEEKQGLNLFKGKGKCANCHVLDPGPNGEPPLFTDFTYDNLGVPRNPANPVYTRHPSGFAWIDLGLGAFLASRIDYQPFAAANYGKMKVPTLRNVDKWDPILGTKIKAYAHNGYFKTLWQIVHFYNTRDAKPPCVNDFTPIEDALAQGCWPRPEVPVNVNTKEMGNLHLTRAQEDAIVEFMETLSDGFVP